MPRPCEPIVYKEGREVRAGSQGNVPGVPSKLSSKLQKANQHLFQGQNYAWSLQDPSQPTSHSKSSMLSGYQVSPELDWSFQSGQDPRTKWETIKPSVPNNSIFFLFSHLSPDHKFYPQQGSSCWLSPCGKYNEKQSKPTPSHCPPLCFYTISDKVPFGVRFSALCS